MLGKIKMALRIKTNVYDTDITDLIEAAKLDLSISGVKKIVDTDYLIIRAIILYCKSNFGNNSDQEKFQKAYDLLKQHLALCGDYNV